MATAYSPQPPPAATVEPPSRPRLFDYLFLFAGVGASAYLTKMTGLTMTLAAGEPSAMLQTLLDILPTLLFLPVGIILGWPIFYATQWLCGRRRGLTMGEWLLGLAWLAALVFTGWCVGKGTEILPFFDDAEFKRHVVHGYNIFMFSMGALALVIWLISMLARRGQPWTHTLGIALMMWPALPLLIVWLGNIKME
jgi:hypothetical protein